MRLLLDTHVFLWYISGDSRLPPIFRDQIRDRANEAYLSVASVWEAVIKHQLGKLPLPSPPAEYLRQQRERHEVWSLSINESVMAQLGRLPPLHRDPFDRMIVAQALEHDMTIVTVDDALKAYAVKLL